MVVGSMNPRADFLVIGAPKAGTTWCHEFLEINDDFFVPTAKDTYFFDRHFHRGNDWYERHFRAANESDVAGEVCHDYMYSPTALERIDAYFDSDVRTVVVLREPTSRSISHLKYSHQLGNVDSLDLAALEQNPNIIELSRYENFLSSVVENLGNDLSILFFEDLVSDPEQFAIDLAEACSPRSVPGGFDMPGRSNASGQARSKMVAKSAKSAARLLDRVGARSLVGTVKSSPIRKVLFDTSKAADVDDSTQHIIDLTLAESRGRTIELLENSPHRINPIPKAWYR